MIIGDVSEQQLKKQMNGFQLGIGRKARLGTFVMPLMEIRSLCFNLMMHMCLLDCLPGSLVASHARLCIQYGTTLCQSHEYVRKPRNYGDGCGCGDRIYSQTGLAPGYVNNLGVSLVKHLWSATVLKLERLSMPRWAPDHLRNPHIITVLPGEHHGVATE